MDSIDLIGMVQHKFLRELTNKETIIPVYSHVESMSLVKMHFGPRAGQIDQTVAISLVWLQGLAWVRDSDIRSENKVKQTKVRVVIVKKVATHRDCKVRLFQCCR
jgi:hypothetical protein